jgi:hypothetical protein
MAIERYGILNDVHFPFEDKARYATALRLFDYVGIKHLYLNGDIGEFQAVSTYEKHPGESWAFCSEIEYINKKFDELGKLFPDMPVTLIEGNHCYRFFRYIRDVAPQMWGLIDCPSLLKFPDRPKWKFVPYGPTQLVKCGAANLYLRHEPLGSSRTSAKLTAENSYINLAFGHTHMHQIYSHKKFGPKPMTNTAYSLGWLGDVRHKVFDYRGPKEAWVNGCTIVEADVKSGDYTLEFISLQKLPALYRGQFFSAK